MATNLDLAGILNEARRQALLTGKPFSDQETQGLTNAWRNAQSGLANERRQNQLGRDQLAQNRWATQAQIDAAGKQQNAQLFGNLINTGGSTLGMDWLKNKQAGTPDNSLVSKGWSGAKDLFNNGMDKMGNPFGFGTPPQAGLNVGNSASINPLATPDISNIAGDSTIGTLTPPGVATAVPAGPAAGALPGGTAGAGAGVPSMIPGAVPDAAPAIGDAGNFAGSLSYNPATATDITSSLSAPATDLAANAGADTAAEVGANTAANLGANAAADTAEAAVDAPAATGIGASSIMPYGWTLPLASGLHKGVDALFNINEDNTGKVIGDIFDPLKGVSDLVGTWICTATAKHSRVKKTEESVMKKLEIAQQETDLPKFYDNIRNILIEPVIKAFDKDPEEAFQIYLFVTQTLFKAYMPEFVFKEIE